MSVIYIPDRRIRRNFKPDFPVEINRDIPRPDGLTMLRDVRGQQYYDIARNSWNPISATGLVSSATKYGLGITSTATNALFLNNWPLNGHDVDSSPFTAIIVIDYQDNPSGTDYNRVNAYHGASYASCGVFINSSGLQYFLRGSTVVPITTASFGMHIVVMRITDGADQQFYRNGVLDYQDTLATFWTASIDASVYSSGTSARDSKNRLLAIGAWKSDLGADFCRELSAEGWPMLLEPKRKTIWVPMAGGGGVTGTGAATTGNTTASGTGTLTHKGTGALTTSSVTASGAGTLTHVGTGALTTSNTTADGTGTIIGLTVTGSGALTVGTVTASGAGTLTHKGAGSLTTTETETSGSGTVVTPGVISGTGTIQTSSVTASGTGVLTHVGTGALTTNSTTASGAGLLHHLGTGDLNTNPVTVTGSGGALGVITGTGDLTISGVTVSGYDVAPVAVLAAARTMSRNSQTTMRSNIQTTRR